MAKSYFLQFGSGNSVSLSGLSPTFLVFMSPAGATFTPPAITELPGTGIYSFSWGTTSYIGFLADAATTSPGSAARYIVGSLDPADRIDEVGTTIVAQNVSMAAQNVSILAIGSTILGYGVSNLAIATSIYASSGVGGSLSADIMAAIGSTASTFGNSSTDPGTLYGYLKRIQEFNEGNAEFTKLSGSWAISSRGGSLLATKTLSNTSSAVTKT